MPEGALTFEAPPMSVSYPTALDMHMIYDSELSVLEQGGKDRSLEIALALGGAGVGLLQNLWKASYAILYEHKVPDASDFVLGLASVLLLGTAYVWYLNSKGLVTKIETLVEEIRARPKKGGVG